MKKKKIRNPLMKRIPRELAGDFGKYLVVSLFLILTIGFVSGMYVANGSMLKAAEDGVTEYKLEDGHFELNCRADEDMLSAIVDESREREIPVHLYENFFRNEEEDKDADGETEGTVRVYPEAEEVNLASVLDGRLPEKKDEIAIDRMHADNAGIRVGDSIRVGGESYKVTGLIACVNYSTLHEKNTDMMFDAIKFDVAMVTKEGFERLGTPVHHGYAWRYEEEPSDEKEEKEMSEEFLELLFSKTMAAGAKLEDYVPRYANSAVNFAGNDMGSDKAMGGVLLDILIVIIAFIFAITISNTITREASTIGTLRASGYTRGELVRHFLAMPVVVTILSAAIGNLLGYTLFKWIVVSMYYNSYSLPEYKTLWSAEAFLKTTCIPLGLMLAVNLAVIIRMMRHSPLQFLRHDLKKRKRKKAMRLPSWSFLNRFRLRIILQNLPNYLVLFVGISFIMIMLAMAVGMPSTLDYYKEHSSDMMFADYQYILKNSTDENGARVETDSADAEVFGMCSLQKKSGEIEEEISIYGIVADSRYVNIEKLDTLEKQEVYISGSFADKYGIKTGEKITLKEKYEKRSYSFKVKGVYDKCQSLSVFMPIDNYREIFSVDEEDFTGYLSGEELEDLPEDMIATVITEREITKMCDQLDHSMGAYMTYFQYLCVLLSAVLIYLLTKLIIEKNETAISMTKILGYDTREIAGLYLLSTSLVVVVENAVAVFLGAWVMKAAWKMIMFSYSGWYEFTMNPADYVKMFTFVFTGYLLVLYFDFRRIKKVPMDMVLKYTE